MTASPTPLTHLPPRLLPILYFSVAHVALAFAFGAVAVDPRGVSGFFYHARILGIVHLVTLGWITASILGSLYVVGPIALRLWIPALWLDYTALGLVLIGIVGMVAHFWLQEYGGMAWSAITVGAGIMAVSVHVAWRLRHAPLPRAVSAHIMLAFLNVLGTATLGVLIGFDKVYHFLPGFVLANVFAHAHLAALGWATMMVIGVAYRLLPMILPAAMPSGPRLWISVVLLQAGVSGLFATLLLRSPLAWIFALTVVAGLAGFAWQVAWMLRRPRPRPPGLRRPDPAVLHAGASFASLGIASVLGVWLTIAEPSSATLRIAMVYGTFGLVTITPVLSLAGAVLPTEHPATNLVVGLRYLTERNMTFIADYFRNGTDYTLTEMETYFELIERGYELFTTRSDDRLLALARRASEAGYGSVNPMRNYVYGRVNQPDALRVFYLTLGASAIVNANDGSYAVLPEVQYKPTENLELRWLTNIQRGRSRTKFGEKQADLRLELRARYYF